MIANTLISNDKIIFLFLHVKLGLMKQFVKVLKKEGKFFEYLCNTFSGIRIEKQKMGFLDGLGCAFHCTNEWCWMKSLNIFHISDHIISYHISFHTILVKVNNYRQLVDKITQRELELWRAWCQDDYKSTFPS